MMTRAFVPKVNSVAKGIIFRKSLKLTMTGIDKIIETRQQLKRSDNASKSALTCSKPSRDNHIPFSLPFLINYLEQQSFSLTG